MDVTPPDGDLEAVIVGRSDVEAFMMGPGETIFLNVGSREGVRVGNTFFVYEQRDQYLDPIQMNEDYALPPSVIGRVMVLRVSAETSTAVITDADRSLWVGARVTTKPE